METINHLNEMLGRCLLAVCGVIEQYDFQGPHQWYCIMQSHHILIEGPLY